MNTKKYFLLLKTGSRPDAMYAARKGNKLNGPIGLLIPINESSIRGEIDDNKIFRPDFLIERTPITKKGKRM